MREGPLKEDIPDGGEAQPKTVRWAEQQFIPGSGGGAERNGEARKVGSVRAHGPHGAHGLWGGTWRHHMGLMSFQAAEQLGPTQIVKILSQTNSDAHSGPGQCHVPTDRAGNIRHR